jgi:ATP-dependent DNA helicase DinG
MLRDRQENVLREIDSAVASDYKYVILEAPTGFGKSPVAISIALTLGSSYICTSTKDLQSQYEICSSFQLAYLLFISLLNIR